MNPYLDFVQGIEASVAKARAVTPPLSSTPPISSDAKVLLFSPHPDDECITGVLPLRLMREAGMQIINIPVTFGSNAERQAAREQELKNACGYLGWENYRTPQNLDSLNVENVVAILTHLQPRIVFVPHVADWNSRHISTHHLLLDALSMMPSDFTCTLIETEFWGAMDDPNVMIEADAQTVADLVAATALHVGEVARNPYHLLLPAWMQDNVRRGGELVGGQGKAAPDFSFATLYRIRKWESGRLVKVLNEGRFVPMGAENLKGLI